VIVLGSWEIFTGPFAGKPCSYSQCNPDLSRTPVGAKLACEDAQSGKSLTEQLATQIKLHQAAYLVEAQAHT